MSLNPPESQGELTSAPSTQEVRRPESTEESGSHVVEEPKGGWSLVKEKLLVAVGASLNFRTLRDMYGDVVLDPSRLTFDSQIAGKTRTRKFHFYILELL